MTSTKTLQMEFLDAAGNSKIVSLADPKEGLDLAAVQAASDTIIAQHVFHTDSGDITALKSARIVVCQITPIA